MSGINVSSEEEERDIRIKQLLAKIVMLKMLKRDKDMKKELMKMKL